MVSKKPSQSYWFGIVGTYQAARYFENRLWWCLPYEAMPGDKVLMYCPRAVSAKLQGIFALCEVATKPDKNNSNNYQCSGYGRNFGRGAGLAYVTLKFLGRFESTLTAGDMKSDAVLGNANFVRRNFQGTVFSVDPKHFERALALLKKKQLSTNKDRTRDGESVES